MVTLADFQIELFPLHSPLLGESLLVSFPPLNNMLKFRGFSHFIWDLIQRTAFRRRCFPIQPFNRLNEASEEERQYKPIHRSESDFMPTHSHTEVYETCRRCRFLKWLDRSLNTQSPTTRWSLFGTDTQRGVVTGLSRDRNLRAKIWWFTEFCNSHYVSHFAAFFIVTGTKISVVKSCFGFVFLPPLGMKSFSQCFG